MAYTPKLNSGSLFRNQRKQTENHPDYTGSIMLEDGEHWLSAWLKESPNGTKYMSLSVGQLKGEPAAQAPTPAPAKAAYPQRPAPKPPVTREQAIAPDQFDEDSVPF
jgi:hypothetical protein